MSNRMQTTSARTNPIDGRVVWAPAKSLWFTSMAAVYLAFGPSTFSWSALVAAGLLTGFTVCVGHSVGFHRLLIHRSFACPRWVEYLLVTTGVLLGMGGPRKMLRMHDSRDWAQRLPECHPFFRHSSNILRDWLWNLHCELRLAHPPDFRPEERVTGSRYYRFLDHTWMLMQLPLAAILYALGGIPFVVWGICGRIVLSLTGHWLIGYIAHNTGERDWHVDGASVQGFNVRGLGLISMGEAWHNNHHAFPESARLGLEASQPDPGWWFVCLLERIGLASELNEPGDLPERAELQSLPNTKPRSASAT